MHTRHSRQNDNHRCPLSVKTKRATVILYHRFYSRALEQESRYLRATDSFICNQCSILSYRERNAYRLNFARVFVRYLQKKKTKGGITVDPECSRKF